LRTNEGQKVQNANCDIINENVQCKDAPPVDEAALRNKITGMINRSEDPKLVANLAQNWKNYTASNPWITKMYAKRNAEEVQRGTAPKPILDWFSDKNFAELAKDKNVYKEAFIKKYVDFAKDMDCTPTFTAGDSWVERHPSIEPVYVEKMGRDERNIRSRKMQEDLKSEANVNALKARMQEISDKSTDSLFICNNSKPDLSLRQSVENRFPPCAGNFKKNFPNNKYDVNPTELDALLSTPESEELATCIKDRLAKGAKVHHISIKASASSLNNTGEAEQLFCKKGFLGLSEARAATAKTKILPGVFNKVGAPGFDLSKVDVQVDATGANGDGSSGKCPYETKNGKEVLKARYKSKEGEAELEASRYVKMSVTFEESTQRAADTRLVLQPHYYCKKITFKCE
jgi:hypothetical protein